MAGMYQLPPQVKYECPFTVLESQPDGKLGKTEPTG